jgi:ubiquinone/menaquinone biosynthesis C-methylase UbiE
MGRSWDTFSDNSGIQKVNNVGVFADKSPPRYANGSMLAFQDFICEVFTEAYRILKPGGHCLVWGIGRTSHHTAMGLERAGFQIKDKIIHTFSSGFPKSRNIWKNDLQDRIENELKKQGVIDIVWK